MPIETSVFDADSIQAELDRDLPHGLRMLADALECGSMDGRCISAAGVGFGASNNGYASVQVRLLVTAPVFSGKRSEAAPRLTGGDVV